MKNKKILSIVLLLIIFTLKTNVNAYTQEIAKATPYYQHPVTGVIEDPGNNPGIGQGMTENVLNPQALVETTDDGRIFLSVRYSLANYIKNETFAVQNYGEEGFYSVAAEVTGQGEETRDYRIEIPSKNVIVRATFFVGPMGRDVIFYYTISDLVPGNTDFASLEQNQSLQQEQTENTQEIQQTPPQQNSLQNTEGLKPVENNVQVGQILAPQAQGGKVEQKIVNSKFSAGDLGYSHGLLTKDSEVIKKIYYSDENEEDEVKEKTRLGKVTMAFIYSLLGLVVIITSLAIILALLSYFYKNNVEEKLNKLRSETYED